MTLAADKSTTQVDQSLISSNSLPHNSTDKQNQALSFFLDTAQITV